MMNGLMRESERRKKKHLLQVFLTISFASFTVFETLVIVTAIIALNALYLEEIWYLIMLIAMIVAGGFLIAAVVIALKKETKETIVKILITTIPILVAIITVTLFYRYLVLYGFKSHYALAEAYGLIFQERMWKIINQLLICNVLIVAAIGGLAIIKLRKKEVKQNSPIIILGVISLILFLVEICGRIISQKYVYYVVGIKMFWGTNIIFALISLISCYFILREMELLVLEESRERKQIREESAKLMVIVGTTMIITSMIWLTTTVNNSQLITTIKEKIPASDLPQLALYAFGTVIIAYSFMKWEKAREKQKYLFYFAMISIIIIIPLKVFSMWYIWNWVKNNTNFGAISVQNNVKPLTLVLTDVLPIAAFLLCTGFLIWREKSEKKKNSWMVIIPSLTMIASVIFLIILVWLLWGTQYDLDNFIRLFKTANSITIIELAFLMAMVGYELSTDKKKLKETKRETAESEEKEYRALKEVEKQPAKP